MISFNLLVLHSMFVLQMEFIQFYKAKFSGTSYELSLFSKYSLINKQETYMNILDRDEQ